MKRMKVFITGHRGYIGSAIYYYLMMNQATFKVMGYDIVDGDDILDLSRLVNKMKKFKPMVVLHLAAASTVSVCNSDSDLALRYNFVGTKNVMTAMKEAGCENIIYTSTSSVYGNSQTILTEKSTIAPCSIYGITKLLGEHVIENYYFAHSGNFLIYRLFNVVGTSGFLSKSTAEDRLFSALQTGKVTIYGNDYDTIDGTCKRDYVCLTDVVKAYVDGIKLLHLRNGQRLREVINISTSKSYSVEQIICSWNKIAKQTGTLPRIEKTYGSRRPGDVDNVCGSNKKAHEIIAWKPQKSLDDIIIQYAKKK